MTVAYRRTIYPEAGPADAPVLLLAHGYPSSSFQFRDGALGQPMPGVRAKPRWLMETVRSRPGSSPN
ncbi:hypothetical protein [Actinoplanes aureus]|uniref:hypothetical protein n=1 Tax=Actinoplanes aureus TaxID=2792083 RepID=UPI001E3E7D8B|nr:hypothetical protein [Actinoplanes aureus]